jgi:TolB protein
MEIESTVQQVDPPNDSAAANLSPATDGQINISAVNVRRGPGLDFNKVDVLTGGQVVDVLATNPKLDWVLVQSGNLTGWVSLDYIDLFDEVETLPVLSAEMESGVSGQESGVGSQESGAGNGIATDSGQPTTDYGQLTAVISAGKTEVRPGPGAEFAPIGELSDPVEGLALLGVDPTRQWALTDPEFDTSRVGWVALSEVQLSSGELADAPVIYTGWTTSNALALRTAPGIYADEVGRLPINNLLRVIGLNEARSWARVQPVLGGGEGWTQTRFLTLSAPVSEMPPAPAPPPAPEAEPIDPAVAAASAKAGKLALQLSSGGEIVTLNADGTGLQSATHGIDPQLSPDGSRLAFTRWEGGEAGNGTLWVKDLADGSETAVLGFIKQPKGADWSPDGSQIVINFQHEGRLDEKQIRVNLTEHSVPDVPWNAGDVGVEYDKGVPYFRYTLPPDPHWGLRVVNVADGSFEDVDGGTYAFRPAWDPAQDWRIVSDGGRGLLAVDVNQASSAQKLTELVGDGSPVFSPDGRYVALESGGGNGIDIYRLNADGSGRVRLTQTPLWVSVTPEGEGRQWNNVSPAWSPDGTQLAFLTDRTGRWEVWVMNADGGNPRPMFAEAINDRLDIAYNFVDERMISWR